MTGSLARRARRTLRDVAAFGRGLAVRPNPRPVFVLGNQKSGTSVIASLLAAGSGCSATVDVVRDIGPLRTYDVLLGRRSFDWYRRHYRLELSRDIVKEPGLTLLFHPLREAYPEARFLLVVRDPIDNARSILDRLGLRGDAEQLDVERLSRLSEAWRRNLDASWLGFRSPHWVEHLGWRWSVCARVHLENRDRVELVRYEDFVADKQGTISSLLRRLDLPERGSVAHLLERPFQPRGANRGSSGAAFFGERNLRRLEGVVAHEASALGYRVER